MGKCQKCGRIDSTTSTYTLVGYWLGKYICKTCRIPLDKKKKYQAWLTKNEYDEKTHYLRNENGVITLYKIISSYKI